MVDLSSLTFGPFSAEYHQQIVTEKFKSRLRGFIAEHIVPQVDHEIVGTDGTLTPRVKSDESCFPTSPLRNYFYLELRFFGLEESQYSNISLQLRYSPDRLAFEPSRKSSLYVWTPSRRAEREWQHTAVERMTDALYSGQVKNPICPICFSNLEVLHNADYFRATCPNECFVSASQNRQFGRVLCPSVELYEPKHDG